MNSVDLHVRDPAFLVLAELSTSCQRRVVVPPPDFIIFAGGRYLARGVNNDATEPIKKVGAVTLAGSIALSPSFWHIRGTAAGVLAAAGPYSALRIASALPGAGRAGMAQAASVRFTAISIAGMHSQLESR